MIKCHFCGDKIDGQVHMHHVHPVNDGGDRAGQTVPAHPHCHHTHHRENGDYARWRSMNYTARCRLFGKDEVTRILAAFGRRGYQKLLEAKGADFVNDIRRKGGIARAAGAARGANGRFSSRSGDNG